MSTSAPTTVVKSLYRSLLREANKLPYGYLRAFFRFKSRDDIVSATRSITRDRQSSVAKLRRIKKDLRQLKSANEGDKASLTRVLQLAYGRVGKLRRELLEPFTNQSTTNPPPPIIPGVEKSRPPVYSRELSALLFSAITRTNEKSLQPAQLKKPPNLPSRVDPSSEDARLLGPLSKRREVNLRWRFFTEEARKIRPPLQVSATNLDTTTGVVEPFPASERAQKMKELGLTSGGFQDSGLTESLESMVMATRQPCRTRREREILKKEGLENVEKDVASEELAAPSLPTKMLRGIHRNVLGQVPLLTFYNKTSSSEKQPRSSGSFEVSVSRQTANKSQRYTTSRLPLIDEVNMAWVQRSREVDKQQKSKSVDNREQHK